MNRPDAEFFEQSAELILDDVGERADDDQRIVARSRISLGKLWNERRQAGILALREGRLDAASGIVQHAHVGRANVRETSRGARTDRA